MCQESASDDKKTFMAMQYANYTICYVERPAKTKKMPRGISETKKRF